MITSRTPRITSRHTLRELTDDASAGKPFSIVDLQDQVKSCAGVHALVSIPAYRGATAEILLARITYLAHKHEVQSWKDAPGSDRQKLAEILELAREGLHVLRT